MKAARPIATVLIALFLTTGLSAQSIRRPRDPWVAGEAIRIVTAIATRRPAPSRTAPLNKEEPDDWSIVRDLPEHAAIAVLVRGDEFISGELVDADSCGIRLRTSSGESMLIGREDVREVRVKSAMGAGAALGMGALFGALSGFVIGRAKECACELHGLSTAFGTVSGLAAGTIVGWKLGQGGNNQPSRVIYATYGPPRPSATAGCAGR